MSPVEWVVEGPAVFGFVPSSEVTARVTRLLIGRPEAGVQLEGHPDVEAGVLFAG